MAYGRTRLWRARGEGSNRECAPKTVVCSDFDEGASRKGAENKGRFGNELESVTLHVGAKLTFAVPKGFFSFDQA